MAHLIKELQKHVSRLKYLGIEQLTSKIKKQPDCVPSVSFIVEEVLRVLPYPVIFWYYQLLCPHVMLMN